MTVEEKPDRKCDPELLALQRVVRMLEALDVEARRRVASYVACRYAQPSVVRDDVQP